MKKLIMLCVIWVVYSNTYSQTSIRAIYKTILASNGKSPVYEELLLQGDKSTYKLIERVKPEKVIVDENTGIVALNPDTPDSIHTYLVSNHKAKMIFSKTFLSSDGGDSYKEYHVKEPFDVKWTFHNESIKIGTYNCKKATTNFRGRTYTAWYTEQVPISVGPWKLHGLPGLAIKIQDNKDEVTFLLDKVETPTNRTVNINNSIYQNTVDLGTFAKLKKIAHEQSEEAFISKLLSQLPRGATIQKNESNEDKSLDLEKTFEK
ncbi:MAG: GLPGLI family protein [Spirosomataceae bacterium]